MIAHEARFPSVVSFVLFVVDFFRGSAPPREPSRGRHP